MMPASFLPRSPLLLLAVALVALAAFVAPGAQQPAQAQSYDYALPPYTHATPAKQVDITIVDDALEVRLRRTKIGRYSAGYLRALDYAGGSPHHVQIGAFAASGTTNTKLALHWRDAAGNNKQTYLVYTFMNRASECRVTNWPTGAVTDGRIHGGRPWFTQTVRTAPNPPREEPLPLQGGWVTLSNHTAQQATGKHLCVGLRFHHEGDSTGVSELRAFSYYMDDATPTLAGDMSGNTLTLTATDESQIFQYRYIKKSCDTASPTESAGWRSLWKSLSWIDAGDGATSKRLVSNKQVEIVFPDGVNQVFCFDAQDMQKNVGRLAFRVDTRQRPTSLTLSTNASNNTVTEGGSVTVTATLDQPAMAAVSVPLSAANASTAASGDYTLPAAFAIAVGQRTATGTVQTTDDDVDEDNENIVLTTSVSGLTVTGATVTIADDDTAGVTLSAQSVSAVEGFTAPYTVRLNTRPTANVTVTPTSATPAAATVSGALTFTAANWKSPQPVTVTGVAQGTSAISHTVASSDSDYSGVSVGSVTASVLESQTKYSVTPALTIPEFHAARALTVTLGQVAPAGGITLAVAYDFSGGTATRADLREAPAEVIVAEGDTTAELMLVTRHDEVVEDDETFTVTVTADAAAQAAGWTPVSGQDTATVTITDDDTAEASVGFWSAVEPQLSGIAASRNSRSNVSVVLSRPPATPVTVEVEVDASSTATEYVDDQNPGDFRIVDKTLTFTPGGSGGRYQTLWVDIADSAETANETIVLRIADHSGNDLGRHYTRYAPNRTYTITLWPRTGGL